MVSSIKAVDVVYNFTILVYFANMNYNRTLFMPDKKHKNIKQLQITKVLFIIHVHTPMIDFYNCYQQTCKRI